MAQDATAVRDKEIQALTDLTQKMREQQQQAMEAMVESQRAAVDTVNQLVKQQADQRMAIIRSFKA